LGFVPLPLLIVPFGLGGLGLVGLVVLPGVLLPGVPFTCAFALFIANARSSAVLINAIFFIK
jgi:hypothetical protein